MKHGRPSDQNRTSTGRQGDTKINVYLVGAAKGFHAQDHIDIPFNVLSYYRCCALCKTRNELNGDTQPDDCSAFTKTVIGVTM